MYWSAGLIVVSESESCDGALMSWIRIPSSPTTCSMTPLQKKHSPRFMRWWRIHDLQKIKCDFINNLSKLFLSSILTGKNGGYTVWKSLIWHKRSKWYRCRHPKLKCCRPQGAEPKWKCVASLPQSAESQPPWYHQEHLTKIKTITKSLFHIYSLRFKCLQL
jgi:hypothetical protein